MYCDLCNKTISANEMVRIPLREMQQAVRDGFNPFKTPGIDMSASGTLASAFGISVEEVFQDWRQRVMADTTDWGLCPACAGALRRWQTPTGERDYSALLESTLESARSSAELAFKNFEKELASDPDTADKFFWLGAACMACAIAQEDPTYLDRAIDFFERALEIDPKHKNAYAKLLGAYMSKRDDDGVRRTAMRWAKVDPDLPEEARQWLREQEATAAVPGSAEEPSAPEPAEPPGVETELPLWADVSRDPSLVDPLILERLEKSMCFMVRDETGPVAALIIRASPDEFRGPLTAEIPMSLYLHYYNAPTFDLYGVYPIVWDDPKQPFFKETWLVGADRVTGPPDPLSEDQLSRLEALLSQKYTYFLIVDPSNHLVAARRVNYSPKTQEHFLGFLARVRAARSVTISNVELISALGEYMNRVSLEEVRAAARRLITPEVEPIVEERIPVIRPEVEEERVYPWVGISKMYRVALVLAALVWLCLIGRAMNVAAQDPIVYLIFAVILLVPAARAIFDALRPTTVREVVISPKKGVIFRRKSGQEKPVIAQIDRVAETQRGKAILIQGLSPEGKRVRAQIARGNLEEGEFERFREDLQRLIPSAKITPVPTRALPGRSIFVGITAFLGVLSLVAFLFTTGATIHDHVKGLESARIPFQTQLMIVGSLLVAFLLFAGLSVFLSERRKIGILFWSGLVVLGVISTGYILAYVWEGGLLREALPSVPITATPVPRFVTFEGDIFSFEYPSNWEVITEKEIDVLLDTSLKGMSPGGYDYIGGVYTGGVDGCRGCAHIVVVLLKDPNLTGTLTDEQYEQVKASYENTMGPRLISIKRTEMDGMPGIEVVNIGRSKDTKLRGVIIVPPEPGIAYSLNCLSHKDSFDDFEDLFARAIETLHIARPTPAMATPSPATGVITYTIQAGDTLGKIAAEFGVTVEALAEANDIEDPSLINVGQVLVIPQP